MISVIISAFNEPRTVGQAIKSIIENKILDNEIIVVAPDKETLEVAKKLKVKHSEIRVIKDQGKGKPEALNLAVSQSKGEILVLTDGDVFVSKSALKPLIKMFDNSEIGAVSGNPISINSKNNKLGYWAYILSNVANDIRKQSFEKNKRFFCSGYLFAIRRELFPKLPKELLSEDGFISQNVYENGFKIGYSEQSKVFVKYPQTFSDWIKQKRRSVGGYNQIKKITGKTMRSFSWESFGALKLFKYVSSLTELLWLFELFIVRIYLWLVIYRDIDIMKKSQKEIWVRIESTK